MSKPSGSFVVKQSIPISSINELKKTISEPESYHGAFSHLLGNIDFNVFLREHWERQPVLFKADGDQDPSDLALRTELFQNIFSRRKVVDVVKENQPFLIATNFSAVKYSGAVRHQREFSSEVATPDEVEEAFEEGYTLQFFQPQRFSDAIHSINASFERQFGCLVGASAYLTPPNSQGLAPHHDDVEVFIVQTEGTKVWHLGANQMRLPETHSHDIPRDALRGKPTRVVLTPGDVLYMPRGTIHEAAAQKEFSTHVTISLYQHYNMKKLISVTTSKLLENVFAKNIELRRGLPVRMSDNLGSFAAIELQQDVDDERKAADNRSSPAATAASTAIMSGHDVSATSRVQWRKAFLERVRALMDAVTEELTMDVLDEAADEITGDFVMHRLPPPDLYQKAILEEQEEEERAEDEEQMSADREMAELEPQSVIKMCDPRSTFVMIKEIDGVRMLALAHSKFNDRMAHMGHPLPPEDGDEDSGSEGDDEEDEGDDDVDESGGSENKKRKRVVEQEDEEEEEDEEEGLLGGFGDGSDEGEGFQWSLFFPVRLAPVIIALRRTSAPIKIPGVDSSVRASSSSVGGSGSASAGRVGITLQALQAVVESKRIFGDEVADVVEKLRLEGFVEVISPSGGQSDGNGNSTSARVKANASAASSGSSGPVLLGGKKQKQGHKKKVLREMLSDDGSKPKKKKLREH